MKETEPAMADAVCEMAPTAKLMRREKASCPLCQKTLSLHFLRYAHKCKRPVNDAAERRERALQLAIQALRARMAAP